jgi:hypothetical protein
MARLKLKQVLSNLGYDPTNNILTVSGSSYPALIISGSTQVIDTNIETGSITIEGVDTFGDSGSFDSVDLGSF